MSSVKEMSATFRRGLQLVLFSFLLGAAVVVPTIGFVVLSMIYPLVAGGIALAFYVVLVGFVLGLALKFW